MGQKTKKVERTNSSIYVPKTPKTIKRLAAWLIDIILIIVVATGVALMTSAIYGYDSYNNKCYISKKYTYFVYYPVYAVI